MEIPTWKRCLRRTKTPASRVRASFGDRRSRAETSPTVTISFEPRGESDERRQTSSPTMPPLIDQNKISNFSLKINYFWSICVSQIVASRGSVKIFQIIATDHKIENFHVFLNKFKTLSYQKLKKNFLHH